MGTSRDYAMWWCVLFSVLDIKYTIWNSIDLIRNKSIDLEKRTTDRRDARWQEDKPTDN